MRLPEIERGDGFVNRLLISFISMVSGMRLPDAARVAFYHKDFFGVPMGAWTQAAMRGPSPWSVAERELMGLHGREMERVHLLRGRPPRRRGERHAKTRSR